MVNFFRQKPSSRLPETLQINEIGCGKNYEIAKGWLKEVEAGGLPRFGLVTII